MQAYAGHILADVVALLISLLASVSAQQPAKSKATFGNQRLEVLAALINGFSLIAIASFIIWEAIHRWQNLETILGLPMLLIAALGLIVNLFSIKLLHPYTHNDLNLGEFMYIVTNTVSSLSVIIAALLVHRRSQFINVRSHLIHKQSQFINVRSLFLLTHRFHITDYSF